MTIQDIAKLFRQYVDEPHKTFLTDDDVSLYLKVAYDQFREIATQADPKTFEEVVAFFPLNGTQTELDLTVSPIVAGGSNAILGSAAFTNGDGMLRLTEVVQQDGLGTGNIRQILRGAGSFNDLYVPDLLSAPTYLLNGQKLFFSQPLSGNFTIRGVKQQDPALWSNLASLNHPDDLNNYHDLIALMAYRNYAVRDGALAQAAETQLAQRTNEFKEYIQFGREMRGSNRVLVEDHDVYYY
jgi:hypothetical protein